MSDPPLTLRTVFPPEINPSSAYLALRRVWSHTPSNPIVLMTPGQQNPLYGTIPKPHGMVTEVSKGGYSLIQVLGWNRAQYKEIQVHHD
jgi:hypothetical protein